MEFHLAIEKSKKMKFLPIVYSLFLFSLHPDLFGQISNVSSNEFTFMFYNTENFFDTDNDSLTNDEEYTPDADRRWNPARLHSKAERLAKVILAAGNWNSPVVIGLCEVEDLKVLELLTRNEPLAKFHYKIVHKDSPDERGIDVALLYRPEFFRPFDYQAIPVIDPKVKSFKTRDILKVSGVINGCDTLHVFVNHWPSRYGGIMETYRYRRLAAETLRKSIQNLFAQYPKAKIICMGDFNDTPTDDSLSKTLGAKQSDNPSSKGELINLSARWISDEIQTIKSKFSWEVFDQFIVSDYFFTKNRCFEFQKSEIFKADFLLESDMKFGGVKPKRTYVGFKYQEGFSDHLPVLLRIELLNH
jgi:hypothetical protein